MGLAWPVSLPCLLEAFLLTKMPTKSVSTHSLIEVRSSPVHGRGVHARHPLLQGTCIGVYEGRRYTAAGLLKVDWRTRHDGMTYLFNLSDGTTIDGADGGNAMRFLNHACMPNCEAVEKTGEDGRIHLQLVTMRPVNAGAELFLDYALSIDESESPQDYPCRCGLSGCRGTMAAV
jgi:SET domain-containing protein